MRIYYFGELIEDTNETKKAEQTKLVLEESKPDRTGMQSVGDILKELNMNLDVYHHEFSEKFQNKGGLHHA